MGVTAIGFDSTSYKPARGFNSSDGWVAGEVSRLDRTAGRKFRRMFPGGSLGRLRVSWGIEMAKCGLGGAFIPA